MRSGTLTLAVVATLLAALAIGGCQGQHELERLTKAQASSMSHQLWPTDYCRAFLWYGDGTCDSFCPETDVDCTSIKTACGPWPGWQCIDGQVCDRHTCGSLAWGTCTRIPDLSLGASTPVCGCNGQSYQSERERLLAGVARDHLGRCQAGLPQCGPWNESGCAADQVCDLHSCSAIAGGDCLDLPQVCTQVYNPVCGCDGNTYQNDCERLVAGVAREYQGECRDQSWPCGPFPGGSCPSGMLCDIRTCEPGASGSCVNKQASRTGSVGPADAVCGCDGNTYHSDMDRIFAGVALSHEGECPVDLTCGAQNPTCPVGLDCNLLACGQDAEGICVEPVEACLDSQAPVCGCDGQTYQNDCLRIQAGVALDHQDECQLPNRGCGPWAGGECQEGMVCDIHGCDDGLGGECVRRPDICPTLYLPVCGCDGQTYGNDCARLLSGVALSHEGPCEIL